MDIRSLSGQPERALSTLLIDQYILMLLVIHFPKRIENKKQWQS